jgi:hypothetical protein
MTGKVPFLMKDLVVLAASFYLLKQDVARVSGLRPSVPNFEDLLSNSKPVQRAPRQADKWASLLLAS